VPDGNGKRGAYERKYNYTLSGSGVPSAVEYPMGTEHEALVFKEQCNSYRALSRSFAQLATDIIRMKKWNVEIFKNKTNLDKATYSRIVNDEDINRKWSLRTVMAFCVGAGIGLELARTLLSAAGFSLGGSDEHCAYRFLLSNYCGKSIDDCNEFLERHGIEPLGGRTRNTDG